MQRGKALEKTANKANIEYRKKKSALVEKVPTPIMITSDGLIPKPSTVDYVGLLNGGQFLAFDAKETKVTTRFDLKNIHAHQRAYLNYVEELEGIAFFLIHFTEHYDDKAYVVPMWLINYWWESDERKSIPYDEFPEHCILVDTNNYLKFLDDYD